MTNDRIVLITRENNRIFRQCGKKNSLGWADLTNAPARIVAHSLLSVANNPASKG